MDWNNLLTINETGKISEEPLLRSGMQKPCPESLFCDHFNPRLPPSLVFSHSGKMLLFHVFLTLIVNLQ